MVLGGTRSLRAAWSGLGGVRFTLPERPHGREDLYCKGFWAQEMPPDSNLGIEFGKGKHNQNLSNIRK